MPKGLCFIDVTFFSFYFLTVSLEKDNLRMYETNIYQIFSIGTHTGGHNQPDLFAIAQATLLQ